MNITNTEIVDVMTSNMIANNIAIANIISATIVRSLQYVQHVQIVRSVHCVQIVRYVQLVQYVRMYYHIYKTYSKPLGILTVFENKTATFPKRNGGARAP